MNTNTQKIETEPRPHCPACGLKGETVYKNLTDRLFDAPGEWSISTCIDRSCGTLWLDPTPKQADISKLYTKYSTHTGASYNPIQQKGIHAVLELIRSAYLYTHYGYPTTDPHCITKLLSLIAYVDPSWRDTQAANIFYLPYVKNGKLLDVGCGNGSSMQIMKSKGWQVVGIDFDEQAIKSAQQLELDVRFGDLFSQKFPDEEFDAIMMNHVIEHVPDPKKLLEECRRILKKDGMLVALTPNAHSRGHKHYRDNWRGLETPQHLQIFSTNSLAMLAHCTGFKNVASFSSIQGSLYLPRASANIAKGIDPDTPERQTSLARFSRLIHLYMLGWLLVLFPARGEVAVLICNK